MAIQIQIRNDTAAQWTSVNPLLAQGEMGIERDTTFIKIGDGVSHWNSLQYASASFAANGGGGTSDSASWASQSLSASYAQQADNAISASWAPVNQLSPGSLQPITASWAQSASNAVNAISASWATVSNSSSWASQSLSASYAPQQQNISVNSITASYISASGEVIVPTPVNANDAVNKAYVDALNPQGLDFYFRATSSIVAGYYDMLRLNYPLSASTNTITVNNVSASQYFVSFISPALNLANMSQGNINVHVHIYRAGGNANNSFSPEIYIRSSSGVEYIELAAPTPTIITTTTSDSFTIPITVTSSIALHSDDELVCKLKCIQGTGTPNITVTVDGGTAAGVNVPVPSSAFVLRTGDTMTGTLTGPGYIGSASFATSASWAPSVVGSSVSASWASQSLSASYLRGSGFLTDTDSIQFSPSARILNAAGQPVILPDDTQLLNEVTQISTLDWSANETFDANSNPSIDWNLRQLYDANGNVILDWTIGTFAGTASYAKTASVALNGGITTGGTYSITSSWATSSLSASTAHSVYNALASIDDTKFSVSSDDLSLDSISGAATFGGSVLMNHSPTALSLVDGNLNMVGNNIINGGTITAGNFIGTASLAETAISASYVAASSVDGTVASASSAVSASYAPQTTQTSCSWASASLSASTAHSVYNALASIDDTKFSVSSDDLSLDSISGAATFGGSVLMNHSPTALSLVDGNLNMVGNNIINGGTITAGQFAGATGTASFSSPITWGTGLGAITHIAGPSDQALRIVSSPTIQAASSSAGNSLTMSAANATAGNQAGGANGGTIRIVAGDGAYTTSGGGGGGNIIITAGNASAASGNTPIGGSISITSGVGVYGGSCGSITITPGSTNVTSANIKQGTLTLGGATSSADSNVPSPVNILGGKNTSSTGGGNTDPSLYPGGPINITTYAGQSCSGNTWCGFNGGPITVTLGAGGANTGGAGGNHSGIGGNGGAFIVSGSAGGSNNGIANAGAGSAITLTNGNGGISTGNGGTAGNGGTFATTLGAGGAANGTGSVLAGNGSLYSISGGKGGDITTAADTSNVTGSAGSGSNIAITSGNGGNAISGSGLRYGGNSGNITIQTGNFGTGSTASGSAGIITFGIANNAKMTISSSGYVGIGVTSPINALDIAGNISCSVITASIFTGTSNTSSYINYPTASGTPVNTVTPVSWIPITVGASVYYAPLYQ